MTTKVQKAVSILLFVLLLLIFGLSLHFVWPAYNRSSALRQDLSKLNHELQEKIDESVSLNREVHDLEHSPAAAEKVAREKYNLCKENELILKYET